MNYDVQGVAQLYLTTATDLAPNEFENRFHEENIIKASLQVTLSNGTKQEIDVMEFLKLQWNSFQEKENH